VLLVCSHNDSHDDDENSSLQDGESVRSGGVRESVIGRPCGIFFQLDDNFLRVRRQSSCQRSHPTPSSFRQRSSSFLLALSSSSYRWQCRLYFSSSRAVLFGTSSIRMSSTLWSEDRLEGSRQSFASSCKGNPSACNLFVGTVAHAAGSK
jgi:hypothetical protein